MKQDINTKYDYGECEICDTQLVEKRIKQDFWINDELIVVDHVLAGVCPQCGAKVVNAEVGHRINAALKNTKRLQTAMRINVPVIALN
jgi:YgiT-type zinc finger domain-containing protein